MSGDYLILAAILIPLLLLVRFAAVGSLIGLLRRQGHYFMPNTVKLMTWGGIRGGISVALALALDPSPERDMILTVTYIAVLFSILVQGLSIGRVVRRTVGGDQQALDYA